MTKVLIATDKPFAPVAVKGIREIVEAQGYELALLKKIYFSGRIDRCCCRRRCYDHPFG